MQKILLDIIPFHKSYLSANISEILLNLLVKYNLTTKFLALTTDNNSVIIVYDCKMCNELSSRGKIGFLGQTPNRSQINSSYTNPL